MVIREVHVLNLRSYDQFSVQLHPDITLILGPNGSGKTSLLEALYVIHRGTSFRGRDRDIVAHAAPHADIKAVLESGDSRKLRLAVDSGDKFTKHFSIDDSSSARLAPKHRLPVVLFEPDELRLLSSSPQRRRDFIDDIISRLSLTYSTVLSRYSRTLLQRNELLKQYETMSHSVWESHLFAWDVKLAELGATIIKARQNFILHSNEHLDRIYSKLAGREHQVTAKYISPFGAQAKDNNIQQLLLNRLETNRQSDSLRGNTSIGPHRDDIELQLDNHPATETASRGEMRSIMLAFKLLEVELQAKHSGQRPLILLDDVFSELDSSREQALMGALKGYQTVITATDLREDLKINASIVLLK